jgi:Fe-S oxidoreductase
MAEKENDIDLIPIFVMGKRYMVPDALTIMKAIEYAGYQYIRGCGCRGGVCGACSTVYRKEGDYKIYSGLACQTVVEPNMYLAQIPFYPALRSGYDFDAVKAEGGTIAQLYPEIFRCVACNACTKICPMDVQVMDYIAFLKRGDLKAATECSFDCIQCGLCASRCMAEIPQYHVAQVARRLYGAKLAPRSEHLVEMVADIEAGKFKSDLEELKGLGEEQLKELYIARQMEPAMTDETWVPESKTGLA